MRNSNNISLLRGHFYPHILGLSRHLYVQFDRKFYALQLSSEIFTPKINSSRENYQKLIWFLEGQHPHTKPLERFREWLLPLNHYTLTSDNAKKKRIAFILKSRIYNFFFSLNRRTNWFSQLLGKLIWCDSTMLPRILPAKLGFLKEKNVIKGFSSGSCLAW